MDALIAKYNEYFAWSVKDCSLVFSHTHILPIPTTIAYLAMVFLLPGILRKSERFSKGVELKWIMVIWNLFLAVISLFMFVGTLVPIAYRIMFVSKENIWRNICDVEKLHFSGPSGSNFWGYIFTLTKFIELIDTLFLILKNPKRDVAFLHWFHHATVLLFTWYAAYSTYSAGFCFILMNSLIHTFMYYYYFLKELGYNPSWALPLTLGQISQMFFGILFNGVWFYQWYHGEDCTGENPREIFVACLLMYGAYLYLFVRFFVRRYITKEIGPEASKKAAAAGDKKQRTKKEQ